MGSSGGLAKRIVRAAIHPSIGIARVGSSPDEFYVGPEVVDPPREEPGFYRDTEGRLKRQAARFRIYGLDENDQVVAELTSHNSDVRWTVHLANKKAAWYQFQLALDIPEAEAAKTSYRRNATEQHRSRLVIDPGPRSVSGPNRAADEELAFDTGRFMGKEVYLGELRTDHAGRLIVLGGRGVSASYDGSPPTEFGNNDKWHDDVSDGPVTAVVRVEGKEIPVEPSWVVVAPPAYAPMLKSVRTMWDLMRDVAIGAGLLDPPPQPSFERDLRPIFERQTRLEWVNHGFFAAFGWGGIHHMVTADWLSRLNDKSPENQGLRYSVANRFRVPSRDSWSPAPWPWLYGDAMGTGESARSYTSLTDTQLDSLKKWAQGDFQDDYEPTVDSARALEDVSLGEQPDMLDRAALEFCLADAFHPGCEMTWPMRHATLYAAPFRIRHAAPGFVEPPGPEEVQTWRDLPYGPMTGQLPGGLTRWMAVPWQTDTASCRYGYGSDPYAPHLPTFWPARAPNQVLAKEDYDVVVDEGRSLEDRRAAFARRSEWIEAIGTDYHVQIQRMVGEFDRMGVLDARPGPAHAHFPPVMLVQDSLDVRPPEPRVLPEHPPKPTELHETSKAQRFRKAAVHPQ